MPRFSLDEDAYFSDEEFSSLYRDRNVNVVLKGRELDFEERDSDDDCRSDLDEFHEEEDRFDRDLRVFEKLRDYFTGRYLPVFEYGEIDDVSKIFAE